MLYTQIKNSCVARHFSGFTQEPTWCRGSSGHWPKASKAKEGRVPLGLA